MTGIPSGSARNILRFGGVGGIFRTATAPWLLFVNDIPAAFPQPFATVVDGDSVLPAWFGCVCLVRWFWLNFGIVRLWNFIAICCCWCCLFCYGERNDDERKLSKFSEQWKLFSVFVLKRKESLTEFWWNSSMLDSSSLMWSTRELKMKKMECELVFV